MRQPPPPFVPRPRLTRSCVVGSVARQGGPRLAWGELRQAPAPPGRAGAPSRGEPPGSPTNNRVVGSPWGRAGQAPQMGAPPPSPAIPQLAGPMAPNVRRLQQVRPVAGPPRRVVTRSNSSKQCRPEPSIWPAQSVTATGHFSVPDRLIGPVEAGRRVYPVSVRTTPLRGICVSVNDEAEPRGAGHQTAARMVQVGIWLVVGFATVAIAIALATRGTWIAAGVLFAFGLAMMYTAARIRSENLPHTLMTALLAPREGSRKKSEGNP
jgi:hypothetical protein